MSLLRERRANRGEGAPQPETFEAVARADSEPLAQTPRDSARAKSPKRLQREPPQTGVNKDELDWKQFSTMLPAGFVKRLRRAALEGDTEIREIVRRAVETELERLERGR